MNIANLLAATARATPELPAIASGDELHCTYGEFLQVALRLAGGLRRLCPKGGARIGIMSKNCPEYMEIMWGAWLAGHCIVPINAKLHPKEVQFILDNCGAEACFVDEELAPTLAPILATVASLKHLRVIADADYRTLAAGEPAASVALVDADAPAWLFFTSGTTGRPKGAMLSHRNLTEMTLRNFADIDPVGAADSIIHVAPFSHASGLFSLAYVAKAAIHVIPASRGFAEIELLELMRHYGSATVFLAPTMLNRLAAHPASAAMDVERIKTIIYGGAPMYLEDLKKALARFGPCLWQGYGQGETPNTICYLSKAWHANTGHPRYDHILTTVGVPRTAVEVRLVDDDDRDMPAGEIGEIIVRSDVTMLGYWSNPEATAKTLRGGWLHTGDLGSFDENGFLSLRDRSKDVIISGGSNIYPREIEEILLRHDGVLEAAVIGAPSDEWGEEVCAFVVAKAGIEVTAAQLDALCLDNIARFKRPKSYRFIESLPKSNYGKILKTSLREKLAQSPEQKSGAGKT